MKRVYQISDLGSQREKVGKRYLEFLRIPAMSAGVYVLSPGETDPQKPHNQDELYYVVHGRARVKIGAEEHEVRPGCVIFVEAKEEHRFFDITEQLMVLVFFAPAES